MKTTCNFIVSAVFALAGSAAMASTLPPTASLTSDGSLTFSSADGFAATGNLIAEYREPPQNARPYIFSTSLSFGDLTITPEVTLTTPEIVISEPQEVCGFFGCFTIPGVTLPSQTFTVNPEIPIASLGTVFEGSVRSPDLPAGDIFGFDYGTPLLGTPLTFGEVVQDQFETGATNVNVAGGVGPLNGTFDYAGVLQPDGETILADYTLGVTGPGLLADLEMFALDIVNDNTDLLADLAFDLVLANNPCGVLGQVCEDLLSGLNPADFGISVDSFGTLSADYSIQKSIAAVPLPAGLPLLLAGVGGLAFMRKRKTA